MNHVRSILAFLLLLAGLAGNATAQTVSTQAGEISKKQVDKFMSVNRSNLLVKYNCVNTQNPSACSVVCSSGGAKLIEEKNVLSAYYAERLNKINGALIGFSLVVDVKDSASARDLWATLQTDSSCYFSGLSPNL